MKIRLASLLAVLASVCLSANAGPTSREIDGYGTATDPDGDCGFDLKDKVLTIEVPSTRPHDLSIELDSINAPRVLQTLRNDFLATVYVDGQFDPGIESTQPERVAYNGAGLVIMADEKNYITLIHGVYQQAGGKPVSYVDIEMRVDGKWQSASKAEDHLIPADKPVLLTISVHYGKVTAHLSRGEKDKGEDLDELTIPESWSKKLQVGVVAISTSKRKFTPQFRNFATMEWQPGI